MKHDRRKGGTMGEMYRGYESQPNKAKKPELTLEQRVAQEAARNPKQRVQEFLASSARAGDAEDRRDLKNLDEMFPESKN